MLLRPFLNDATLVCELPVRLHDARHAGGGRPACRSGRSTTSPRRRRSAQPIVAVFETHVQADHVSGLPELVERTGATAYLPAGAGVEFEHVALDDGDVVELGNTLVTAIATPGHAPAHHAYAVADRRRGTEEPWLVFTGDSLLIGDVGRPDLHVAGDARGQARLLHASLRRLLELPDHVVVFPSHYARLGLRPRTVRQPGLLDRLRARSQRDARARGSRRVRRCTGRGHAAAAARAGADRRRQPRAARPAAPHEPAGSPRPARERRPVLAAGRR